MKNKKQLPPVVDPNPKCLAPEKCPNVTRMCKALTCIIEIFFIPLVSLNITWNMYYVIGITAMYCSSFDDNWLNISAAGCAGRLRHWRR